MKRETIIAAIEGALLALDEEIQKGRQGLKTEGELPQLEKFKRVFTKALSDLRDGKQGYMLGVARVIADSWSYDSKLGSMLLDAEHSFQNAR